MQKEWEWIWSQVLFPTIANLLCDLGQVPSPLYLSFPSVKGDNDMYTHHCKALRPTDENS